MSTAHKARTCSRVRVLPGRVASGSGPAFRRGHRPLHRGAPRAPGTQRSLQRGRALELQGGEAAGEASSASLRGVLIHVAAGLCGRQRG